MCLQVKTNYQTLLVLKIAFQKNWYLVSFINISAGSELILLWWMCKTPKGKNWGAYRNFTIGEFISLILLVFKLLNHRLLSKKNCKHISVRLKLDLYYCWSRDIKVVLHLVMAFVFSFLFPQHMITLISSRVSLNCLFY